MQLEGNAYNWYMQWKKSSYSYNHDVFKYDFFNRFQDIIEKFLFAKLTRLQQKGDVDE
jgi:hypothetical protein